MSKLAETIRGAAYPDRVRILARLDPVGLLESTGERPWKRQAEIMRAVWAERECYVRSCHGAGKTWLAARVMATWALAYVPDVLIVTIAPTEDQITAGIWRELQAVRGRWSEFWPGELGTKQWTVADHGIIALGRSPRPDRPGTLQGLHSPNMLVVVDEAPEVDERLWVAIRSLLTGSNTRLLAIGNPTSVEGEFYRRSMEPLPSTAVMRISGFETPNLAHLDPDHPDMGAQLLAHLDDAPVVAGLLDARVALAYWRDGGDRWTSRVLAEFVDIRDDTLIRRAWIDAARSVSLSDAHPLEAGMDVARYGDDRCVLFPRRGGVVAEPLVWQGRSTTESLGRVRDWARENKRPKAIRIDAGAMGPAIIDPLIEEGWAVTEVDSGSSPDDSDLYADRRSEMWWHVRDLLERGELDFSGLSQEAFEALKAELVAVRYSFTSAGRRKIEPKAETKKRLKHSPDLADALVYAFVETRAADRYVGSF